jgi:endonuclease YncB( thermonuclease family)
MLAAFPKEGRRALVWSRYPRHRKSAWQRTIEAARREMRRAWSPLAPGVILIVFALGIAITRDPEPRTFDPRLIERRSAAEPRPSAARPAYVIDGDTIDIDGTRIRLADINAPEIGSPKCDRELALGRRAKQRLAELIAGGPIEVQYIGGHNVDRYGRKLRVIKRDGRSLGDILVAEGLARRWNGSRRGWCG